MPDETSYDARVYRTEVYKGSEVTTYRVRWKVGGKLWREGFRTAAQADSFRSAPLTAARKGEAFSQATGRQCSAAAARRPRSARPASAPGTPPIPTAPAPPRACPARR
jgi:hypothetical protein